MALQYLGNASTQANQLITRGEVTGSAAPAKALVAASSNTTITAAQNGALFVVTGSITLTLPAASGATSAAPLYYSFEKRDGGAAVATIATNGADTIVGGTATARLYQEEASLISFGGPWYWLKRNRGWVPLIAPVALTAQTLASLSIITGFGDPDIREVEMVFDNLTMSASTTVGMNPIKNGAAIGSAAYQIDTVNTSTTTVSATSANSSVASVGLIAIASKGPIFGTINARDTISANAPDTRISFDAAQNGATRRGTYYEPTAAALGGFTLTPTTGTLASISYTLKGFRP